MCKKPFLTVAVALLMCISPVGKSNGSLVEEISAADNLFFDAFNHCDIDTMERMFAQDLEFYHDIAGVSDFHSTMDVTRANCERQLGLVRTLIPSSVKVYPVKDFGAIQLGEHQFCHVENGKNDCGTFGFTHVWHKTQQGWKIHRVISYGH